MDCLAKIGGAILGPVFSYMFAPVGHQLEYLFSYKDKIKNLENQVRKLDGIRKMLQSYTEQAKNEGYAIKGHVQDWQKDATTKSEEAKHFLETDPHHTRARCSCRWPLPNLALRRRLSKKAKEMAEEIALEIEMANTFGNNISFRPAVQLSFEQKDFKKFKTREETLREMMETLRNPEVRMIGLCGLGGMGKTMLVKEVARLAKEANLFSRQIMVVVSQNLDIERIQQQIADQLRPKFEKEVVSTGVELLGERLKEEKILIVLDDVRTELDLSEVGIRFNDDNKECKIILTSRSQGVCRAMGADEKTTFEIKGLNNEEATDLFNEIVGDIKPEFESLATEVIGECGGLPLAIMITASALKINQSLSFWRDALLRLKRLPAESENHRDIHERFKTSFDALGNEAKSLLLICSVYKDDENVSLQELMGYAMVLDLFRNVRTLRQASDRVESLVNNFKAYCLLSDGDDPGTVKVPDVVRDVALSIASELEKNPMYCLRKGVRLEDCLNRENFKELYAISVPGGCGINDDQLPERLKCPRLKLLMLRTIGGLEITDRFFEETEELKALRLDVKGGKKLSSSFRSLQNLKALHLRIWKREDVAIIGELTNLLILDLSDSQGLVMLPKEIGNLSRLQLLNLNRCEELKVIEPNVISRLVQLEELYMGGVWYLNWGTGEIIASLMSEIKDLPKLRVLHIDIRDGSFLPEDMFNHLNLERYLILIGDCYTSVSKSRTRVLWVQQLENTSPLYEDGFQRLMKKSDELRLYSIPRVSHIVNELDASSFQELQCLELIELENLESFMPTSPPTRSIERPTLFNDKVVFNNLQELTIERCKSLLPVWAWATFESLQQLKKLCIENCDLMEEVLVITKEAEDYEETKSKKIPFPKLESLELKNLPKLKRFGLCQADDHYTVEFSSLLRIDIIDCPELRIFMAKSITSMSTTVEEVEERRMAQEILFSKKVVFSSLQELTILRCKSLRSVWALATFESLQLLKKLRIDNCDLIEEVLVITKEAEDHEETKSKKITFPKLESLQLNNLPKLKRFGLCEADDHCTIEFPSLLSIFITPCPELRTFIANSIPSMSTTVEKVEERRMAQEILFSKKVVAGMSFRNLQLLKISVRDNVQYMFSFAMVESLIQLKELRVSKCEAMEQIVTKAVGEDGRLKNISFPKLESLELQDLPKLKRFCEGDCIELPSLLKLKIRCCYELRTFISNSHESTIPTLQAVDEERDLEAQQPLFNEKVVAGMSFRNLQELTISECNNVWYMFSFAMVESLIQLKKLYVSECKAMEQIVTKAVGEDGTSNNIISFPELEHLELQYLPKLKRFCEGYCIEFPSLLKLRIWDCYELRTFNPNSHESTIPTLQAIDEERELEAQQPLFNEKVVVTNLTDLQVWECHGLISLFNSTTATSLAQLRKIIISKCNQMTQVIHVNDQMEDESAAESEIVFSQLTILALNCLPNLKCFHGGNNKLQFPNLEKIIANECPEMISFSLGTINTPNLSSVTIAQPDDPNVFYNFNQENAKPIKELWEGDLNRSIRKLWDDSHMALRLHKTVDDQNSEEDTAGHDQKIQNNKENAASSSSK